MSNVAPVISRVEAPADKTTGRRPWLLVLLLVAVVYLGSAFSPALQDDADSTHAEAAREMYTTGDYVTLHINGVRYLEKAPLMYWAVAASYHIFGVNEFAVRVPTVLAMLLLTLLALRWGERAFGRRTGFYAGLFVTTAAGYYLFTRILIPEAILSLLVAAAFYCFLSALDDPDRYARLWYVGYAMVALAVLTKGLLALVVIGGTSLIYLAISGEWRRWREFRILSGLLLLFAIAAPWHLLAGLRNPRFFWFYFVNEHFLRFLGKRYPVDYNKLRWYLYWTLHLAWLFPWSLFLPLAVRNVIRDLRHKTSRNSLCDRSFGARTTLLCMIWAAVLLGFFAFSTNQEYYTVPAYFPILLLLAGAAASEEESGRRRWMVGTAAALMVIALAGSGVLVAGLWSSRHLPFVPDIGTVLAKPDLKVDTLSMGHMLDLTGQSFAALRMPAVLAVIALGVGCTVAFWLRLRQRPLAATVTTATAMALFLVAAHVALVRFDPYLSSRKLAAVIAENASSQDHVMIYGDQAFGSSLLFYLKRPVELVNGRTTSMWFGSTYPDAPHIFLTDSDLLRVWSSGERAFLFVPQYERARVDSLVPASSTFVVAESSGKVVYSNRP